MATIAYINRGSSIELEKAVITSVKTDVVKREIKITIVIGMTDEGLEAAYELARLVSPDMPQITSVTVQPMQEKLNL